MEVLAHVQLQGQRLHIGVGAGLHPLAAGQLDAQPAPTAAESSAPFSARASAALRWKPLGTRRLISPSRYNSAASTGSPVMTISLAIFEGMKGVDFGPYPAAGQPPPGFGYAEPGVLGSDYHVALGGDDDAGAQRVAVDGGDYRLPVDGAAQVAFRIGAALAARALSCGVMATKRCLMSAPAQKARPRAVDDADPCLIVGVELQQRLVQVLLELRVHRVEYLRAVEHYVGQSCLCARRSWFSYSIISPPKIRNLEVSPI